MHQTLKLPNKAAVKTIAYVKISANFFLFFFFWNFENLATPK